jgi:hypothetical protein
MLHALILAVVLLHQENAVLKVGKGADRSPTFGLPLVVCHLHLVVPLELCHPDQKVVRIEDPLEREHIG